MNEAAALDAGDPDQCGQDHKTLRAQIPQLNVLGGCCGTDQRHVEAMCKSVLA
ncbi:MAG: homocysteine S-methyltransferase family protein [Phycisphaeraceae bacterium]|nr:homocysteine S-methyltransferase family protein [Phycisphaeraceae bacterium]